MCVCVGGMGGNMHDVWVHVLHGTWYYQIPNAGDLEKFILTQNKRSWNIMSSV